MGLSILGYFKCVLCAYANECSAGNSWLLFRPCTGNVWYGGGGRLFYLLGIFFFCKESSKSGILEKEGQESDCTVAFVGDADQNMDQSYRRYSPCYERLPAMDNRERYLDVLCSGPSGADGDFYHMQKEMDDLYNKYIESLLKFVCNSGHGYGSFFTPYMNPFNWAIFFVLGMCWKEKENPLQVYSREIFRAAFVVFFITMAVQLYLNISAYYWTWLSIPFEISGIILLLGISFVLRDCRLFRNIGQNTMFIFMVHMIMCGVVVNHVPSEGILAFFHPAITLVITYAEAWILRKILMACRLEWMNPVFGIGGE